MLFSSLSTECPQIRDTPQVSLLTKVLMGDPEFFDVVESINVHMSDANGKLQKINRRLAQIQWENLAIAYRNIGVEVVTLPSDPSLVDMVFTANPCLVLPMPNGEREVWLSKMAHPSRAAEVNFHAQFFADKNIKMHSFSSAVNKFEGCGDGILHPGRFVIHAGTGPRTTTGGWQELEQNYSNLTIFQYQLQDARFYHLDTALAPLNEHTAMYVPSAFNEQGVELLKHSFSKLIELSEHDALNFAANAHCPDGIHVLIQQGSRRAEENLQALGFTTIPLDTSEFMKSGGSVFCMKMGY